MSAYPKHYLANVPQDLRLRVLDLCIHRQWHDALDLLHQNGFTQYEWYELVWFHDHAPTNLDLSPTPEIANRESQIENPQGPEPRTLTTQTATLTLESASLTVGRDSVEPNLNAPVKLPKPRGKLARLPEDVRDNLNSMLASGTSYSELIQWLSRRGYPGFNKVNLHNWRITAFKKWLDQKMEPK